MNTELVTQLVILATAVVGLYKAATFRHRPAKGAEASIATGKKSFLSDFWDLGGVLLFMLAFPAFIWLFMKIMLNMSVDLDKSEPPTFVSVPKAASELEMQMIAAANVPNENQRGEALKVGVESALSQSDYRIAISAAGAIPNENTKGDELQKIVETLRAKNAERKPSPPAPHP